MRTPSRLIGLVVVCLAALQSTYADAQGLKFEPVTKLASTDTGLIEGKVTDERGKPLDGAVISALGGTTAFAVSDASGQYTLKQLPPGPYLVRVHLAGFGAARFLIHAATGRRGRRAARDRSIGCRHRRPARDSREERRSRRERAGLAPPPLEARRAARNRHAGAAAAR